MIYIIEYLCESLYRAKQWVENCGLPVDCNLQSKRLCADHFEEHMFTNAFRTRLTHTAVPTVFTSIYHDVSRTIEVKHSDQSGVVIKKRQVLYDTTAPTNSPDRCMSVDNNQSQANSFDCTPTRRQMLDNQPTPIACGM